MNTLFVNYSLRFNRKNTLNSNGEALIQIGMYLNGQTRFYSTEIYVKPSEWNDKKGFPRNLLFLLLLSQKLSQQCKPKRKNNLKRKTTISVE
jgi:Arm DNA-binding domain